MTKQLRDYQVYGVNRGTAQNLLIADQCGVGKTLQAIGVIKEVQSKISKPALVIAPNETVKLQWKAELEAQGFNESRIFWLDSKETRLGTILGIDALDVPFDYPGVVLTHYEAMRKHIDQLSKVLWSVVIADEAHRIKNRKAQRSEAIKRLQAYRKIELTGTPYDKDPSEIWSLLNWLAPEQFRSYWSFYEAHVNYHERILRDGRKIKEINPKQPIKDVARFARVLRPFMIQRTKEDVRADLPPKIETFVQLEMYAKQAQYYRKIASAKDPYVILEQGVETSVSIVLTQILREIQVTTDPSLLGLAGASSVKLDWVDSWLEDNPNESVIIFTRFRETAEKIAAQYPEFKLIVGGNRSTVDSSVRKIVGTIAAMGEGLDLPHIDNAIFIDVEYSSILMQQAIDRIHRINIDVAKNIYYLCCVDTVDNLVHEAIRNKWNTKELAERYLKGIRKAA